MGTLQAQLAQLQAQFAATSKGALRDTAALDSIRGVNGKNGLRQALNDTGMFRVEAMKAAGATQMFTSALQKQDVSLAKSMRSRAMMNEVIREQYRLQKMSSMNWTTDARGGVTADAIIPRDVPSRLTSFRQSMAEAKAGTTSFSNVLQEQRLRLGVWAEAVRGGSTQMINWGKNMQWAGRQLMVGFTLPFVAFGALSAKLYHDVDENLTKITRVYDYTGEQMASASSRAAAAEGVRTQAMYTATQAARLYGMAITETIDVSSQLAAQGQKGADLWNATLNIQRAAMLGNLDYNKTIETSVALSNVWQMETKEVGDAFNYMNAMENATVLTMQDFVETIPRIAGILQPLGGTLQDVGLMMTGMKAAGIPAAQGANALKSALGSMLVPSGRAAGILGELGINIKGIVAENDGNLLPSLQSLANELEANHAPAEKQAELMYALFGKHQAARVGGLVTQLRLVTKEGTQMNRAFAVGSGGAAEWAAVAARELEAETNSASRRFKTAIESMKAQLASAGEPFLEFAADAAKAIGKVIGAFNDLGDGTKKFILWAAAIAAIVGPIIMITGLFANFVGQIIRAGASLVGAASKFKIFSLEQRLAGLAAKQAESAFSTEAQRADLLRKSIEGVSIAMRQLINDQRVAAGLPLLPAPGSVRAPAAVAPAGMAGLATAGPTGLYQTDKGQIRQKTDGGGTRIAKESERLAAREAAHSAAIAENSRRAKEHAAATARSIGGWGMGVGFMASMVTSSGSTANNIARIITYLGMASMMMPGLIGGLGKAALGMGVGMKKGIVKAMPALNGAMATAKKGVMALAPAAGPFGLAIAAIGVSAWFMHKGISATRAEVEKASKSAQTFADILGFAYSEQEKYSVGDPNANVLQVGQAQMGKVKEGNEALFNELKDVAKDGGDMMARAQQEGYKARMHGAGAQDAKDAAAIAYQIMHGTFKSAAERDKFMFEIDTKVNWEDPKAVADKALGGMGKIFEDTMEDEFKEGKGESVARFFTGDNDANARAGAKIRDAAKEMYGILMASADGEARAANWTGVQNSLLQGVTAGLDRLDDETKKALDEAGLNDPKKLFETWQKEGDSLFDTGPFAGLDKAGKDKLKRAMDAAQTGLRAVGEEAAMSDDELDDLSLDELRDSLGAAPATVAALEQIADAASGVAEVVLTAEESIAQLLSSATPEQLAGAVKDTWTNAWGTIIDNAAEQVENRHEAAMEQIEASGERRMAKIEGEQEASEASFEARSKALDKSNEQAAKKFESRWDATMKKHDNDWKTRIKTEEDAYDARIKKIDDAIKAEQDAEAIRQKIFAAEVARMQRLSEMFNQNVDFNMALNSGDMDAAAKVMNTSRATTAQWALDDAGAGSEDASAERVAGLEKEKEGVEKRKSDRITALEEVEAKEKEALEAKKDREKIALDEEKERLKESLEAEKDRAQKGFEARKAAAEKTQAAVEKAAQKGYEAAKKAMDDEIAAVKAFVPTSAAEREEYTAKLEGIYAKHGIKLDTTSKEWATKVTSAMDNAAAAAQAALANDIKWKQIAENAANQMTSAFGMDKDAFMAWVTTGQLPKEATAKQGKMGGTAENPVWIMPSGKRIPMHTGGRVSPTQLGGRNGVSEANSRMPSEIDTRLRVGEYVVKKSAVNKVGTGFLDDLNEGRVPNLGIGGGQQMGPAGFLGAGMVGLMRMAVDRQIKNAAMRAMQMAALAEGVGLTPGEAGEYAGTNFQAEQMQNAASIIGVGRQMGASDRDIIVGLMTALQESGLRNINHGDRDSLGLFQQRPSQGWGTEAQILDPQYSSRKFFEGLLAIPDRNSIELTEAAQAVQRSAFPGAYAKWEDEARAILAATNLGGAGGTWSGGQLQGGFARPLNGYRVSSEYGMRTNPVTGEYKLHNGIDLAAPNGTGIFALQNGTVLRAGPAGGYGNWTVLGHPGGLQTGYAHQSRIGVKVGQQVKKGQRIGDVGSTGNSSGPHLHLTAGMNGAWVNPRTIIPGLKIGGNVVSEGIAKLHEKETVLTAPLSESLKSGIKKIDEGAGTTYNVTMDLRGAYIKEDIDIESALDKALAKKEGRIGVKRKIS